ncbi:MAG: HIT domain-containing protein [Nanoarchaeota archaeon]|nr:HIT domain-containing protein [Nanoarchaeota archaeon]
MLSPEQAEQIKSQIIAQIEQNFPQDKKNDAKSQIMAMNDEELEVFLKRNSLIQGTEDTVQNQECVFCSIIKGDTSSYKIDENQDAIAVLEINPISKGHSLIIPKEHISSADELPSEAFNLAKQVAKRIKSKFNPKDVVISSTKAFNHIIINLLPIYEQEHLGSQRTKENTETLEKIQKEIEKIPEPKKPEIIEKEKPRELEGKIRLPRRIP